MNLWGNIYQIAMSPMQTLLIVLGFIALYSETLIIPCCFFDGPLKQRSWNTNDFLLTFNDRKCFDFIVLIWESLMFHWCFSDVLLMLLWGNLLGNSNDLNANKNDHLRFFSANLWINGVSLLLHWIFVVESLKKF